MSDGVRFQVLVNGQQVCLAGIDGDGVLTAIICRVANQRHNEEIDLRVGGLERIDPASDMDRHFGWNFPGELKRGYELTIRILDAGEFDQPSHAPRAPFPELDDPVYGKLIYSLDLWGGLIPLVFTPSGTTHVQVRIHAGESGPSERQRDQFIGFRSRLSDLWPKIAELMAKRSGLSAISEVAETLDSSVCLEVPEDDLPELTLVYGIRAAADQAREYVIVLRDWEIVEFATAE